MASGPSPAWIVGTPSGLEVTMIDLLTAGFGILLDEIWIVPLGVFMGMIVGAIPGLSPSNSLAMMLPMLLTFPPELGLIFAVCVYTGAEMGNSFPAIMLNVPGTPGASITALEGYQMTERGEAAKALGISILASAAGGLIGGVLSITAAPALAWTALKFSPVEVCIVVLFGLAIIAQMSVGGLMKGLLAGFLGMMLATIGTDPLYGQFRGTWGSTHLIDGLSTIALLVGLLGFSEMLLIVESRRLDTQVTRQGTIGASGLFAGFQEVVKRPIATLRSGIIGLLIGIVPGAGASVAAFVAYQQAKVWAPSDAKQQFGKGSTEGLIAIDTANNAVVGGSLVPLLTLGLPGSATAAVMLVIMGYHGLAVGPRLFAVNGDIAYAILWSQFAAAAVVVFVGGGLAYFAHRLAKVPVQLLVPVITLFCLIGGFVRYGQTFDMGVVVAFGVLGYLMRKTGYPVIALLLGFILGPIFEQNLFLGLKMGFGTPEAFLTRPVAILLWALLIGTFVGPHLWRLRVARNRRNGA